MQPEQEFIFGRSDLQARKDLQRSRGMCALLLAAFLAVPIVTIAHGNEFTWLLLLLVVFVALFASLAFSKQDIRKRPDLLWRIVVFPDGLLLSRLWSGTTKVPFGQVADLTVQYSSMNFSYDRLTLTIAAAGETWTTGPCQLKGEIVEEAAAAVRQRVKAAGGRCGGVQTDRELRLAQVRSANRLAIISALFALALLLLGTAWIAADIPEDLHFRFQGIDAQGTIASDWSNQYSYSVAPGDIRHGTSKSLWRAGRKAGDTFPIRYSRDDPDRSRPLIDLPILSLAMYALCIALGLAAAGLSYLVIQSCRGHIACYGRGKFFFIHPGELEDDYLRGA